MKTARYTKVAAIVAGLALIAPSAYAVTTKPTTAQKAALQYLVEEEKLARDVYAYLAANVTTRRFANIVKAEQFHMDQISALLKTYGVYNPTTTRAAGVFKNVELQKLYNTLTVEGAAGQIAAFGVGVKIEDMDIEDLKVMLTKDMPADMKLALDELMRGSQNHLAAFKR